ncbi:MAG: hypothetical protein FRX49_11034 [Trebouxia sp. A1-2]|nr:MAG: hypothetical protein FRX49_11034 [Trebouxia sp. A1-2]
MVPAGGGQMGVRTSRTQGRAGQGPVEAEPATRFPVAHDGRSQVHQAATPVNHFVKIRLCFRTPFQDSGESAHTHILPILQAPHLGTTLVGTESLGMLPELASQMCGPHEIREMCLQSSGRRFIHWAKLTWLRDSGSKPGSNR